MVKFKKGILKMVSAVLSTVMLFSAVPCVDVFAASSACTIKSNPPIIELTNSDFKFTDAYGRTAYPAEYKYQVTGVTDDRFTDAGTRDAFCINNKKSVPTGSTFNNMSPKTDATGVKMARALYFGYYANNNNSDVKGIYGGYATNSNVRYEVTRMVLSKLYSDSYVVHRKGSSSGLVDAEKVPDKLKKLYNTLLGVASNTSYVIPTNNISVSSSSLTVSVKNNKQVTSSTTVKGYSNYNKFDSNNKDKVMRDYLSVPVPANVTLVNETTKKSTTGGSKVTARVNVGETFHFEAGLGYTGNYSSGNLSSHIWDFYAYTASPKSNPSVQPVATYCWANTSKTSVKITANFSGNILLQLNKVSAQPDLTDGNGCYSLSGAIYNIYSSKTSATNVSNYLKAGDTASADKVAKFGYIKTDSTGFGKYGSGTNGSPVAKGTTYYAVERTPSKGYELDTTVYEFKDSGKTADGMSIYKLYDTSDKKYTVKEEPLNDPAGIFIQKYNALTGTAVTKDNLGGAIFEIKYYAQEIDKDYNVAEGDTAPSLSASNLKRTWYFKTDNDGISVFSDESYLVNTSEYDSENLYYAMDESGSKRVTIPAGTIVIKEVKAPEGYEVSKMVFYRQITDESNLVNDTNTPIEVPIDEMPSAEISTVALGKATKSKNEYISSQSGIVDTVTYSGFAEGKTYYIEEHLYVKNSNGTKGTEITTDASGSSKRTMFVAGKDGSGTVKISHNFNSLDLANKSVVVFATVYDSSGNLVYSHEDINDTNQTVKFFSNANPNITTKAYDSYFSESNPKYIPPAAGNKIITDNVYFTGLNPGQTYYLYTQVYEIKDGVLQSAPTTLVIGSNVGVSYIENTVTATNKGTAVSSGSWSIEINVRGTSAVNPAYVVYEYLLSSKISNSLSQNDFLKELNKYLVASHTDPNDSNQTVQYTETDIDTTATIYNTSKKVGYVTDYLKEKRILEEVTFTNLNVGTEYYVAPYMVNKSTNERLANAKVYRVNNITGKLTLITTSASGNPFKPEGGSYAYDDGLDRCIKFTAVSETQKLKFVFDLGSYSNDYLLSSDFVICEEIVMFDDYGDITLAGEHNDLNDADQTVSFITPTVSTRATDSVTNSHYAYASKSTTIYDSVNMTGLIVGGKYTLETKVVVKGTGNTLVTAPIKSFTATRNTQTIVVPVTFDSSSLVGKKVVIYERLYYNGSTVAYHNNINDTDQTVTFLNPSITTTASVRPNSVTHERELSFNEDGTPVSTTTNIYDTVSLSGLIEGESYKITGMLVDKSLSDEIITPANIVSASISYTDSSGSAATANMVVNPRTLQASFNIRATGETQQVRITYVLNTSPEIVDRDFVAFETLIYQGTTIADHSDINDADQTVSFYAYGSIKITKLDSYNGKRLEDVKFNLYSVDDKGTEGSEDDEYTLLENRFNTHSAFATGTYYYSDISSSNFTDLATQRNYDAGQSLAKEELGILTIYDLPTGKYKLVEKEAPNGYVIDVTEGVTFTVKAGMTESSEVLNTPTLTSIDVVKTDNNAVKEEIRRIQGAGFKIYSDEACTKTARSFYGNIYSQVLSDEEGKVHIDELKYSNTSDTNYYLKETLTPEGYIPLDYILKVTIKSDGVIQYSKLFKDGNTESFSEDETVDIGNEGEAKYVPRIINDRGSVILNKKDHNGNSLAGSEWELHRLETVTSENGAISKTDTVVKLDILGANGDGTYRCNDSIDGVTTLATSESGTLSIENLPLGDYYFVETKAPEGKMPYGDKIHFSLTADKPHIGVTDDGIVVINNNSFIPNTGSFGDNILYLAGTSFLILSLFFALYGIKRKRRNDSKS